MLQIQFIDNNKGYLDIEEGETVLFNFGAKDARDISKTRGVFSKEIRVPCTKNNDTLLNNYFDVNIQAGTFDVNKKQKVDVIQRGVSLNRDFFLQLKNIIYQNDNPTYYVLQIRDNVADFFNSINNLELTDLDFSDGDHINSADSIAATFPHSSYTDGLYKYHLTSNTDDIYNLNQFKPAIFAYHYFDRIFSNAGFQWEWQDFDGVTTQFDKQIIPACKSNDTVSEGGAQVEATDAGFNMTANYIGATNQTNIYDTEVFDPSNLYNPGTGEYTADFNYQPGQSLLVKFTGNLVFQLQNTTGGTVTSSFNDINQDFARVYFSLRVLKNGSLIGSIPITSALLADNFDVTTPTYNFVNTNYDESLLVSNISAGDILTFQMRAFVTGTNGVQLPALPLWNSGQLDHNMILTSPKIEVGPAANNTPFFGEFIRLNNYIPNKVKQSDFIKSIVMMNNLWIDPDASQGNKIVLKKRDVYLDEGEEKDYSKKLDLSQEIKLDFLPDLVSKRSELTYKQDKDTFNQAYEDALNQTYGEIEYIFESEHVRGKDTKTLVFSPTPLHDTSFGAFVPAINGYKPDMNIRILLVGEELPCGQWTLYESFDYELTLNTYPYVGHFDNPITPSYDLNFSSCQYYFYDGLQTLTPNNLFNLNWRRQHNQINTGRLLTAYFNLDEQDIRNFKLNDKWYVKNRYWNVQKIIDYDTNKRRLTKVELISADDEISLPVFSQGVGVIGLGSLTGPVLNDWVSWVVNDSNTFQGVGDVLVKGKNNTVLGDVTAGLVAGNGLIVKRNGLTTEAVSLPNDVVFTNQGMQINDFDVELQSITDEWRILLAGNANPFFSVDGLGTIKIGLSTSRLGFFGATPISQPAPGGGLAAFVQNTDDVVTTDSTFDGYTLQEFVRAIRDLGILQ